MKKNPLIGKGLAVGIILLFVGTCIIPAIAQDTKKPLPTSRGSWLYVGGSGPGNYTTIQSAINAANAGDMVFVYNESSPYHEHVNVNKSISVIGEDKKSTVIDGDGVGYVVTITADGVIFRNFTVQSAGTGIAIFSNNSNVSFNIIQKNHDGISFGHHFNNSIFSNRIINNYIGIDFLDTKAGFNNNMILKNIIAHNDYTGIWDDDEDGGTIATWNVIAHNGEFGLFKHYSGGIFHHNDFFFNYDNVRVDANIHNSTWDDGHEGNYWDDWIYNPGYPYTYIIKNDPEWPLEIDHHPSAGHIIDSFIVATDKVIQAKKNEKIHFRVAVAVDPTTVTWHWDFGDGTTSNLAEPYHTYNASGIYHLVLTAIDSSGRNDEVLVEAHIGKEPDLPSITGPIIGKAGVTYNYTFWANDPEGDDVYIHVLFDKDEVVIGSCHSSEKVTQPWAWKWGRHIIQAYAVDIDGHQSATSVQPAYMYGFFFNLIRHLIDFFRHIIGNYWGRPCLFPTLFIGERCLMTNYTTIVPCIEFDRPTALKPYDIPGMR